MASTEYVTEDVSTSEPILINRFRWPNIATFFQLIKNKQSITDLPFFIICL